jgi:hypothetical protein
VQLHVIPIERHIVTNFDEVPHETATAVAAWIDIGDCAAARSRRKSGRYVLQQAIACWFRSLRANVTPALQAFS